MRKLEPGVYDDGRGGMHLDIDELLIANGFALTDENRRTMEQAMRDIGRERVIPVSVCE